MTFIQQIKQIILEYKLVCKYLQQDPQKTDETDVIALPRGSLLYTSTHKEQCLADAIL